MEFAKKVRYLKKYYVDVKISLNAISRPITFTLRLNGVCCQHHKRTTYTLRMVGVGSVSRCWLCDCNSTFALINSCWNRFKVDKMQAGSEHYDTNESKKYPTTRLGYGSARRQQIIDIVVINWLWFGKSICYIRIYMLYVWCIYINVILDINRLAG